MSSSLPYELFIGWRYTRAKRRNQFVSFISLLSMSGIALGVMALITVLSVMNGFQRELRSRILGVAAHVEISTPNGRLPEWVDVAKGARNFPGVLGAAPYVSAQGMLTSRDGNVRGAQIRGILPDLESTVVGLNTRMLAGRLNELAPGEFGIVLGRKKKLVCELRLPWCGHFRQPRCDKRPIHLRVPFRGLEGQRDRQTRWRR